MKINKYIDVLIIFYFFNMIVFANGSMISKIGKLLFVALTTCVIVLKKMSLRYREYYLWMLLFLIYSCASITWAFSSSVAVDGVKSIALNFLCVFMLTQLFAKEENWINIVAIVIMICPLFMYIRLFVQNGITIFGGLRNIENGNHNAAGMYAAWGIAFGIFYILVTKDKKIRWKLLMLLNFILMTLSMSRKAVLYVGIPFLFLHIFSGKNIQQKVKKVLCIIGIIIISYFAIMKIPFLYKYIGDGLETIINFAKEGSGDVSAAGRRTRIAFGLAQYAQRPFLGWGAINYNELFGNFEKSTNMLIADNNYIDILVNFGLIGFILYYSIFSKGLYLFIKCKAKLSINIIMAVAILFTIIVCDYGVSSYIYLHSQTFIAIAICLLIQGKKINNRGNIKC